MATAKLLGSDDGTGVNISSESAIFARFQAITSGRITEFKVKFNVSGQCTVAIYADSSSYPGARLSYNDTAQNVVAGWNTLSIPELDVTSGTPYWLAVAIWTSGFYHIGETSGGTIKVKPGVTSGWTWPDPADAGMPGYSYLMYDAGWGILVLSPSSIVQPVSYGTPTVTVGAGGFTIQPSSIVQVVAIGTPALLYPQTLLPSSIVQAIVYGTPSVGIVGQAGYIYPQSIVQQIAIGSPTLLKYVWHVILDGQYIAESPDINRAYVIGRDAYGNPIYGEAHDSAESGLVGERLDFIPDPAIPTTAQAGDVASAVLSKMRLRGKGGVILIPPNCGQELFDVVQLSDSMANQLAVNFRVVGLRFEYNPKQARYQHRLILGAP
jgi:hypothetical protein